MFKKKNKYVIGTHVLDIYGLIKICHSIYFTYLILSKLNFSITFLNVLKKIIFIRIEISY